MKKILALVVALCLAPIGAQAWWQSVAQQSVGVASYQGLADIAASPKGYWGLRAMSAATRGQNSIRLCDDAGNNCTNIATNAATGLLNSPGTLGSNDCTTSGTCRIATIYDQSGALNCAGSTACDLSQGTNSSRPTLTWSCINSLPCAVFVGTQTLATSGNFTALTQTFSLSVVASRSVVGGVNINLAQSSAQFGYSNAANTIRLFAGSGAQIGNVTDSSWHAFQAVYAGASTTLLCGGSAGTNCSNGGTSTTVNPGTGSMGGAVFTIATGGAGPTYQFNEEGVWAADNTSVRSALNSNQLTFWGPF